MPSTDAVDDVDAGDDVDADVGGAAGDAGDDVDAGVSGDVGDDVDGWVRWGVTSSVALVGRSFLPPNLSRQSSLTDFTVSSSGKNDSIKSF